jgi:homoserine kinase
MIRAFAPASIGNVAAGFDVLGAAIAPCDGTLLGDIVEVEASEIASFSTDGPYAHRLPANPELNLVTHVAALYSELRPLPPLRIVLHKVLPVNSGLGSSSASIVAALVACESVGGRLGDAERLALVGRAEGRFSGAPHLDNVAPALLGGLRLVADAGVPSLPWPDDLRFIVVHPHLELSTAVSRQALPREFALHRTVEFAGNLAVLVHALHAGDRDALRRALRDPLAEPHRAPLVLGFSEAKQAALGAGALGASLSGSGPSVFAVAEAPLADAVLHAMKRGFSSAGVRSDGWVCALDAGARVLA